LKCKSAEKAGQNQLIRGKGHFFQKRQSRKIFVEISYRTKRERYSGALHLIDRLISLSIKISVRCTLPSINP